MKTLLVFLSMCSIAFAGVMNGDSGNGAPHGTVTVTITGGTHGDYKVTFTDDEGSSQTVVGTPTVGGAAGETEDTDWAAVPKGGQYRIHNGRLQKKNKNGDPVDVGSALGELVDEEMDGTLPFYDTHVPGPKPTPPTPDDTPPELEEDPLPPL